MKCARITRKIISGTEPKISAKESSAIARSISRCVLLIFFLLLSTVQFRENERAPPLAVVLTTGATT
jgi:hypothetical protein